jgi:hypothetical protein
MRLRRREEERSLDFDMDYKNLAREHGAPPEAPMALPAKPD